MFTRCQQTCWYHSSGVVCSTAFEWMPDGDMQWNAWCWVEEMAPLFTWGQMLHVAGPSTELVMTVLHCFSALLMLAARFCGQRILLFSLLKCLLIFVVSSECLYWFWWCLLLLVEQWNAVWCLIRPAFIWWFCWTACFAIRYLAELVGVVR